MKVVQFLASKGWGGMEKVFLDLCNTLSKKDEIHVIVFAGSDIADCFNSEITVHYLKAHKNRFNPMLYLELRDTLKKINPNIVHTHGAKAAQIIHHLGKLMLLQHVATKHNSRKGGIFNKVKYVTAVSNDVAATIKNNRVKVIYNGLIAEKVILKTQENKVFTMIAVGRLDKIKGFDVLINECAKLKFNFLLQIVGDGEEKNVLQTLINDLDLYEKVNLLGFRKDIPQMMQDADVVVVSSHNEGFSLVALEALFYAQMLISRKVGIAKEVCPNNFLIDEWEIAKKISEIYINYEFYKSDFTYFKEDLQPRFLLKNVAVEYENVYQKILND